MHDCLVKEGKAEIIYPDLSSAALSLEVRLSKPP
jgi:hypothetical protein